MVRLRQGDYGAETEYSSDPLAVAADFHQQGATWLHVVDLDGARSGQAENRLIVEALVKTGLDIQLGGGIRTMADLLDRLQLGVRRVIVGSALVDNPDLRQSVFRTHGEQVVAGVDLRSGYVATHGWIDSSPLRGIDFLRELQDHGASRVVVTDIGVDGMLSGPSINLYEEVLRETTMHLIASGGVGSLEDLMSLKQMQPRAPEAVIIGKALYEGRFMLRTAIQSVQG